MGDIHLQLFFKECSKTVENFCVHSKNGYYNGHVFHRVIKGFMIQTGDPLGKSSISTNQTGTTEQNAWYWKVPELAAKASGVVSLLTNFTHRSAMTDLTQLVWLTLGLIPMAASSSSPSYQLWAYISVDRIFVLEWFKSVLQIRTQPR